MEMHPTQERLLAWMDGDPEAQGDELAAHVEACARCQRVLEGVTELGAAVRLWAEDCAPEPAGDLADGVLAAAAEAGVAGGNAASAAAGSASGARAPAGGGNVVPLAQARRRRWPWAAGPVALAVAAALVFAVLHRGPSPNRVGGAGGVGAGAAPVASAGSAAPGSEVLAVSSDEAHDNVSVMEVPGDREGTTVAVVWIDDESDSDSNAVQ
jgi:hypothetical protein